MFQPPPPPPRKCPFFAQKRATNDRCGPKSVLLELRWSVLAPPAYFTGARPKKTCVAAYESRETGGSAPPQKKAFLPQNGRKMPFLGQKQCFSGSGGQFKAPPPYFCRCSTHKKMCRSIWEPDNGCFRAPPQKKSLKMPILGQKQCFFGLAWPIQAPPHPILQVLTASHHVLQGIEAGRCVFQGRPPSPQMPFYFWAKNSVFRAWVFSSRPAHPFLQVLDSNKIYVAGYGSR